MRGSNRLAANHRTRNQLIVICLVWLIGGCIPSPNAPLGESGSNPRTKTTPKVRPPVTADATKSQSGQPEKPGSESETPAPSTKNEFVDDLVPRSHDRVASDSMPQTPSQPSNIPGITNISNDPTDTSRLTLNPAQSVDSDMPLPSEIRKTNPEATYIPPAATTSTPVTAIPDTHSTRPIPDATLQPTVDSTTPTNPTNPTGPAPLPPIDQLAITPPSGKPVSDEATPFKITAPLIPREAFFGTMQRTHVRVSPDGKRLAFLAEHNGVMNVFVAPVDRPEEAVPVTTVRRFGLENYLWAFTSRHILYLHDESGGDDYHVYSVSLDTDETKDLTPLESISARIMSVSEKSPAEILVGVNDRPPYQLYDVHRVNIVTGEHVLELENPGFADFVIDDDYRIRFGVSYNDNGGMEYLVSEPESPRGWSPFLKVSPEDALSTSITGFNKTGRGVYLLDSRNRNTAALTMLDLESGKETTVAESEAADISNFVIHPTEKSIQAVTFTYDRKKWQVIDSKIDRDLEYLHSLEDSEVEIASRTLDDKLWTVAAVRDNGSPHYYLYDRDAHHAKLLFRSSDELDALPLVKMHSVVLRSRDGWPLVGYLSLPPGSDSNKDARPDSPLPMVLSVHGGPWARDVWGYNPLHQLLANRGYAVLSVNYRGSTGFGKQFLNAANGQWAGKMHEDLLDAVRWAIDSRIADRQRIAIMGGSFGGYAALVGMTFSPDMFACGIDISGPSNLVTLLENPPPYWMPFMPVIHNRVGDHQSPAGQAALMDKSPIRLASQIRRPMLIAQGAEDPQSRQSEKDQIVDVMRRNQVPVTYLVYPHEGHGLREPRNRYAFYAAAEAFLADQLGGRFQPPGDVYRNAEVQVIAGREYIHGMR